MEFLHGSQIFFPHVAVDISISTNVEDDYFFSYFSLTIDDGGRFKKTLTVRARETSGENRIRE